MKKRFMALCLTFIFLINVFSVVCVSAATYTSPLANLIVNNYPNYGGYATIDVPTDISVKLSSSTNYENGPVTLVNDGSQTVDFQADIDMTVVKDSVQVFKSTGINYINLYGGSDKATLLDELNSCEVEGQFIIGIKYPENFTLPATIFNGNMQGFSSSKDFRQIFKETATVRTSSDASPVNGVAHDVMYIYVDVKDNVTVSVLESYLDDLYLTCEGISVGAAGKFSVLGVVSGSIKIVSPDYNEVIGNISYVFSQEAGNADPSPVVNELAGKITGTVIAQNPYVPSPGPGGTTTSQKKLEIVYGMDIKNDTFKFNKGTEVNLNELVTKTNPGYKMDGFYYDAEFTKPADKEFILNENTVIYVKWIKEVLINDDHFAYVIGYPVEETGRNEVRPENYISREEIVTIFYRLLTTEERNRIFTSVNNFPDVEKSRWSNKAISSMANGKYIIGYEDGTFDPEGFTTRAEFVTIAARFYNVDESTLIGSSATFPDIDDHWAENYIKYALNAEWIQGYEDHTFRPDAYITRAEVMTIINNMLNRHVNEDGLCEGVKRWDDNPADAWYYYEVIEATNSHDYVRADGEEFENWTKVTENKVWTEKEHYEDAE